ncbi:hypothetical protein [Egicoccus sp. AB-alg2]|uniref:AMIN-like domain-containing (lipo)protein n=1 Tax=Egicoccus sp. AB-alg2 TaxID=3242693 RepID=UPI00359DEACC
MRTVFGRVSAGAVATMLGLTACDGGTEVERPDVEQPAPPDDEAAESEPSPEPGEDPPGEDPTGEDPAGEGATDEPVEQPADDAEAGPEPMPGEPGTELVEDEGAPGDVLAVTDVRVGAHDGFDRVVIELDGDGQAGWFVQYDEPRSQGSGEPVAVAGGASLSVALSHLTLPPELPDDMDHWFQQSVDGPAGGVVLEVRDDTIFEGMHLFFVGVDEERPFVVARLDEPQRVVVDLFHEG